MTLNVICEDDPGVKARTGRTIGTTIMRWADELALASEAPDYLVRTYLSGAHRAAAKKIANWMAIAGMSVRFDAAGNVIGTYEADRPCAPILLTGSHFDTVNDAGKYDGMLGILLPIACIAEWNRQGRRFPFSIEVVAFAEEEGVRFKATLLGSRALAGTFDPAVLDLCDADGVSMREAMKSAGLAPETLPKASYAGRPMLGFLEVHIEQGPVLLERHVPVGVVTSISGASRFLVTVTGRAGHAGTVPMRLRQDAAMAAAEIALYIERRCSEASSLVGTVGKIDVPNGAANVVPGRTLFTIDIRAEDDAVRLAAVSDVLMEIRRVSRARNVDIDIQKTHEAHSVPCAPHLQEKLRQAIRSMSIPVVDLPSGAGHDTMAMAAITRVAMLFVRCGNGGISHHPDESITEGDAGVAAEVFMQFVDNLAAGQATFP